MKYIPAVSVKDGHVVVAEDGAYRYLRNDDGQFRSPVNLIRESGFEGEELFILDIDGLERNSPNLDTVKRMAAYKDIWLDAGTPDSDSMMDLFVSDVSRVVLSTLTLASLEELEKALDISDNIIFAVAYDSGVVSPDPAVYGMDLAKLMDELGRMQNLKSVMLFDLGSLRDRKPIDADAIAAMAGRFERLCASGWLAPGDTERLEGLGVGTLILDFRTLEVMQNERT